MEKIQLNKDDVVIDHDTNDRFLVVKYNNQSELGDDMWSVTDQATGNAKTLVWAHRTSYFVSFFPGNPFSMKVHKNYQITQRLP